MRASLDDAAAVADAVLFEGYLLYPYRASAQKNALRWQFGVLVPPGSADGEPSRSRTECLVEPRPGARLALRLRFLHRQRRTVCDAAGSPCERLEVDGTPYFAWEEGVPREVDAEVALDALRRGPVTVPVRVDGDRSEDPIRDAAGVFRGTCARETDALTGRIVVGLEPLPGPYGVARLRLDVVNDAEAGPDGRRDLDRAFLAAHTVLALDGGAFVSSTDPPEWAAPAVRECTNEQSWPVLAGPEGCTSLLLATPIILPDHPQLAPESPTDLFDGTENDELLTLRTAVLTDAEKREARATDPRAAALLDAVEAMGPAMVERLHGVVRPGGRAPDAVPTLPVPDAPWWNPGADAAVDPSSDAVLVGDVEVRAGSAVVLWPRPGGDAQDLFLRGRTGVVQAVLHDVDGLVHVAVALDDDPADLQTAHGRFRYFAPDELAVAP